MENNKIYNVRSFDTLVGARIYLREISLEDVQGEYYNWLKDPEVIKYLEIRFKSLSKYYLTQYVSNIINDPDNLLLAIIAKDTNEHIGNIKLGPINWIHGFAHIGILIGEKSYWGKGIATEAILMVTNYAFSSLNLNKLFAGAYDINIGSQKAFKKAGFNIEARIRNHYLYLGEYISSVIMSINNEK